MKKLLAGVMILAIIGLVGNAFAAESLIPLEKTAKEMNKLDTARFEQEQADRQKSAEPSGTTKEASTTKNPSGNYAYSGLPCKWMRTK